jgi:phosphoglucosamine mutase
LLGKGSKTGKLFGTDGIRGEAGRYPLDEVTTFAVGRAIAMLFGKGSHASRVVVGRDTRVSGPTLEAALESGVRAAGGVPLLVGVLPTAGVAYVTRDLGADAGVVISASHNPYHDNGIKVFCGNGSKLSDDQEQQIEDLILGEDPKAPATAAQDETHEKALDGATERYIAFLKDTFPPALSLKGLKVALDTANGAACMVAPAVFAELGAEVIVIHEHPNGININDNCGSEHTEDLRGLVVSSGADIGLAFDGDSDRLMAVDETGSELTGDQTIIICAQMLKADGRLKNDQIVSTIMSNVGLGVACKRLGLKNHAADVGDRHVLEDMQRLGAVLGGEPSGHVVFLDQHTTGDGILTGIQLAAAMLKAATPLSELAELMQVFPQTLINVEVTSKPELHSVPEVVAAIEQAKSELKDQGRVLVRYSGTQGLCRVMVEGPTVELTRIYAARLAEVVKAALG